MKIVELYLKLDNRKLDKTYDYIYDLEEPIYPGQRVRVPFGNGDREVVGFVFNIKNSSTYDGELKYVSSIIDKEPILTQNQIQLAKFLTDRFFMNFFNSLSFFTKPKALRKNSKGKYVTARERKEYLVTLNSDIPKLRGSVQNAVVDFLKDNGDTTLEEIKKSLPKISKKTLDRLVELEVIQISEVAEKREEIDFSNSEKKRKFVREIRNELSNDELVTLIDRSNYQRVVIFPEIRMAENFYDYYKKYGKSHAFLYTSETDKNSRLRTYEKVKDGSERVVIGSNAALFLPYQNLETIIINQAGSESYSSSSEIHFDTVETAEKLSELNCSNLFLLDNSESIRLEFLAGTQNDWLESNTSVPYINYKNTKKRLDFDVIDISLLDISKEIISTKLKEEMKKTLDSGERVILFLNRKGYYNILYCSECGATLKCPECGSILRSRKKDKEVNCKYCNYSADFPEHCLECGGPIEKRSIGVEKVVEEVEKIFDDKKVAAYTADNKVLEEADIIIATRFILGKKKIDNVGLTAALMIDLDVNFPDYSAPESAYRIYHQFFNTYFSSKHIIQTKAINKDFLEALCGEAKAFLEDQLEYRKLAKLPPYYDLYVFTLTCDENKTVKKEISAFNDKIKRDEDILLPVTVARIKKGHSSRRFILKTKRDSGFEDFLHKEITQGLLDDLTGQLSIVLNPLSLL